MKTNLTTVLLILGLCTIALASDETPVLKGVSIEIGPRIDGNLHDSQWQLAQWFSDFRQSEPFYGQPATERTEVAILYDENNIYIAVRCFDSEPDKIIARNLRHRSGIGSDDNVTIVLDTFQDEQRAFLFRVNPLGARSEAQITGNNTNDDWEEVWDVGAQRTAEGWEAEFRIPLRVLRFVEGTTKEWNINVSREIRRKREEVFIVPPEPPRRITDLNYHGILTGLDLKPDQRNLQFIPYLLGGVVVTDDDTEGTSDAGFDVKYSLTSNLTLDLTYNTDFAQVEADNEQINLTRFSLFFPEKREFFLENAQLFNFGPSGHGGNRFLPFFSRRIGIFEGKTVPIDFGARLTGKVGQQDVGIISMRTSSVEELGLDDAFYNVVRVKRNLEGRSYLGLLATDSRRGDFSSNTFGSDISFWVNDQLELRGHLLKVREDGLDDHNLAWRASADFTSDNYGLLLDHTEVGKNFIPDLGFVRRNGFRSNSAFLRMSRRPNTWLRRWTVRSNNSWTQIIDGPLETASNSLNFELDFESGEELRVDYDHSFERLFESFDLSEEIIFVPGDYSFDQLRINFETDNSRKWEVELGANFGTFFDADRRDLSADLSYVFNPHFRMSGEVSNFDISNDGADINWTLVGLNARYTFNASFDVSSFIQYNSESGDFIVNFRAHLLYGDDSDLYIVFNERRFEDELGDFRLENRQALVKINYRYFF